MFNLTLMNRLGQDQVRPKARGFKLKEIELVKPLLSHVIGNSLNSFQIV